MAGGRNDSQRNFESYRLPLIPRTDSLSHSFEIYEQETLVATALFNERTRREYRHALQVVLHDGHKKVMHVLLRKYAGSRADRSSYGDALCVASEADRGDIVELLLDRSAGIRVPTSAYGDALYVASN